MGFRAISAVLAAAVVWALSGGAALADCTLGMIAELPVTMHGHTPTITVKINSADAHLGVDTGSVANVLSPGGAAKYKLHQSALPFGFEVHAVGGQTMDVYLGTADNFTIAGSTFHSVQFLVTDKGLGGQAGFLGEQFLRVADVEYDLANGVVRLFKPRGCDNANLAYWASSQQPYSVIEMGYQDPNNPLITGAAAINGQHVRVIFDTGAAGSVLTLGAAARAGVKPTDPNVVASSYTVGATQRSYLRSWIAPFSSFKIGDEEIKNFKMRIGDLGIGADMLLGADFFLAHRVLVSNSQHKIYFTYNGGPVFDMTMAPSKAPDTPQEAAGAPGLAPPPEIMDADAYSRHAAALASRRDFDGAIADLTHAIQLAPTEPRYLYERAMVHRAHLQPRMVMDDLNQALTLKPDYIPALLARAWAYDFRKEYPQGRADLDAADKAAAKDPDARLVIAVAYTRANFEPEAIAELDQWIDAHPKDDNLPQALNDRCWLHAMRGEMLDKALADCNLALRLLSGDPGILESRGLVHLRLGQFDKAISDYNGALNLRSKSAWGLYGRGLAELKKGMKTEGDADIAGAKAASPTIADEAAKRGLTP